MKPPASHNLSQDFANTLERNLENLVVPRQTTLASTVYGSVNAHPSVESRNVTINRTVPQQYRNVPTSTNVTMAVKDTPIVSVAHDYQSQSSAHLESLQRMSGCQTWFPPPAPAAMPSWHQPQSKQCANCGQEATEPCLGCKKKFYCGDECMAEYWTNGGHCYECI